MVKWSRHITWAREAAGFNHASGQEGLCHTMFSMQRFCHAVKHRSVLHVDAVRRPGTESSSKARRQRPYFDVAQLEVWKWERGCA